MKIIIILTLVVSIISCGNAANTTLKENKTQPVVKKNNPTVLSDTTNNNIVGISYKEINISGIKLGDNVKALHKFGKVDSITTETSDFDSPNVKRHYWKKSYFEIDTKGKITGFFITDNIFILENFQIKIGDSRSKLESIVKDLFSNSENVVKKSEDFMLIRIDNSDDYIKFSFKNDILRDFGTWSDL